MHGHGVMGDEAISSAEDTGDKKALARSRTPSRQLVSWPARRSFSPIGLLLT